MMRFFRCVLASPVCPHLRFFDTGAFFLFSVTTENVKSVGSGNFSGRSVGTGPDEIEIGGSEHGNRSVIAGGNGCGTGGGAGGGNVVGGSGSRKVGSFPVDRVDAADQDFDYMFKLLIVGDSCVGKTSFLFRYTDDVFHSGFVTTGLSG